MCCPRGWFRVAGWRGWGEGVCSASLPLKKQSPVAPAEHGVKQRGKKKLPVYVRAGSLPSQDRPSNGGTQDDEILHSKIPHTAGSSSRAIDTDHETDVLGDNEAWCLGRC